jgi:hypothetical protein
VENGGTAISKAVRRLSRVGVAEFSSEEVGKAELASLLGTVLSCRAVVLVDAGRKLRLSKQGLKWKKHVSVAAATVSTASFVIIQSVVSTSKDKV